MVVLAGTLAQAEEYDIVHDLGDGIEFLAHAVEDTETFGFKVTELHKARIKDVILGFEYPLFSSVYVRNEIEDFDGLVWLCENLGFDYSASVGSDGLVATPPDTEGYAWMQGKFVKLAAGLMPGYNDSNVRTTLVTVSKFNCFGD
jgi:hypothetical protein